MCRYQRKAANNERNEMYQEMNQEMNQAQALLEGTLSNQISCNSDQYIGIEQFCIFVITCTLPISKNI